VGPVIGFLGAVLFGTAAGASAIYVLAVNLARIALLSLASKLTAPKLDLTETASSKLLTVRGTVQPQGFTYGRDMISGPLIWAQVAGDGSEDLHRIVAMHGREIDSIIAYRIDDDDISIGSPGDMSTAVGAVTGGKFAGVLEIDRRLGSTTQTAMGGMTGTFPSLWTSDHRARSWSLMYAKMTLEAGDTTYENGIPQNLRALCDGHLIYDPRLDSTQVIDPTTSPPTTGSGAHRTDDDTTWEWSENPALLLADFIRWDIVGMGEEDDRVDWPKCAAAADICDELVLIPPASPTTEQKRYTCNLTFFANRSRDEIKEMLETSMLGRTVFSQGQWKMWAGAAITPDVILTEANLAGAIQMQASTGSQERYNRVRGKFIDPSRNYTAAVYPEQRSASFEASDTEVRYNIFDINTANNSFEAQRDAIIRLRQSRLQRTLVFPGNWSCFRVQPGSVVQLSVAELGLDTSPLTKWFVTEWVLQKNASGVSLTLVEEDDTVWADPDVGDYAVRTPTGELLSVDQGPVKLTGGNIHNSSLDATTTSGVQLNSSGQLEYANAAGVFTLVGVPDDEWMLIPGDYWVRATLNSGTLDTGTEGTWEALSTSRSWTIVRSTIGTDAANITLEIADDQFGSNVLATAIFDLTAEQTTDLINLRDTAAAHTTEQSGTSATAIPLPSRVAGDVLLVHVYGKGLMATPAEVSASPPTWGEFSNTGDNTHRFFHRVATNDANDTLTAPATVLTEVWQMASFNTPNDLEEFGSGDFFVGLPTTNFPYKGVEADASGDDTMALTLTAKMHVPAVDNTPEITNTTMNNIGTVVYRDNTVDDTLIILQWGYIFHGSNTTLADGEWTIDPEESGGVRGKGYRLRQI